MSRAFNTDHVGASIAGPLFDPGDRSSPWVEVINVGSRIKQGGRVDIPKVRGEEGIAPFLPAPRGTWHRRAACASRPDLNFFRERGDANGSRVDDLRIACGSCPVRVECLADAYLDERDGSKNTVHGIRAGLSARARLRIYEEFEKHRNSREAA